MINRILILSLTLFAGYNIYIQTQMSDTLDGDIAELEKQIHAEKRKQVELKQQQNYVDSKEYIKNKARENFGLVGEDESIIVITDKQKKKNDN